MKTSKHMELFAMQPYAGRRICVALSGGRDSVALLHYFHTHAREHRIALSALTCEHGLRGEASLSDLAFVQELCAEWGIPLRVFRADVAALAAQQGIGTEEAGRNWRRACFAEVLREGDAELIATAHHRDDFAETVLFRLARGTALAGLNAFSDGEGLIRPLLAVTRAGIDAYIRENALAYREDASNADVRFARNRLRREVLPALEKTVPGAAGNLCAFARRAARDEEYLAAQAQAAVREEGDALFVPLSLPDALFSRACLYAMRRLGICKDYTSVNFDELARLRGAQSGRRVCLPEGFCAVREHGDVVFEPPRAALLQAVPFAPGSYSAEGVTLTVGEGRREGALHADADAFPEGCVIRTRREGDTFTPFGGSCKPLKKFLTDKKIAARRGRRLMLVAKENTVYAVCGVEISDAVKVTKNTVRTWFLLTSVCASDEEKEGE